MDFNTKNTTPMTAHDKHLPREAQKTEEIDTLVGEVMQIGRHFASLPVLDQHTLEEMLYDERGLPT